MTGTTLSENLSVLDTTILSNFAYIDRVDLLAALSGICTVPVVRKELQAGLETHLDPSESQAFAVADAHDGRLLTDDGDARTFAKEQGITVTGSVGVLLAAIDADRIDAETADQWLKRWIDEIDYYVPYRNIADYH